MARSSAWGNRRGDTRCDRIQAARGPGEFGWGHSGADGSSPPPPDGTLQHGTAGPRRRHRRRRRRPPSRSPLVESGRSGPRQRLVGAALHSARAVRRAGCGCAALRRRRGRRDGDWHRLTLELHDAGDRPGRRGAARLPGRHCRCCAARVRLRNEGTEPLRRSSPSAALLTSAACPRPTPSTCTGRDNDWLAECRWSTEPLRAGVADITVTPTSTTAAPPWSLASRGSWPTDGHLPMGALTDASRGRTWLWQIESAGRLALGARASGRTAAYVALCGPTDAEHQWRDRLAPGEEFTTVPGGARARRPGFDAAPRRAHRATAAPLRRPHPDHTALPGRLQRLHEHPDGRPDHREAAAADRRGGRGRAPSTSASTPAGTTTTRRLVGQRRRLAAVARAASPASAASTRSSTASASAAWCPGCGWSPRSSACAARSPTSLPDEAFFQRDGVRVIETRPPPPRPAPPGRAARTSTRPSTGSSATGASATSSSTTTSASPRAPTPGRRRRPGAGLLGHARAHLDWLAAVLDRHPRLVIENCASGGMRMDGAMLRRRPAPVHQRPAGPAALPADRRRRADRRPAGAGRRLGVPAARRSPTTRSASRWPARCWAGSTSRATSTG